MPVWPKNLCTFGVSLKTAATEWKLRQKRGAGAAQWRTLRSLLPRLAATSHWRTCGVESGMDYPKFQSHVPLHTPAQLAPAIERMKAGERDVLWPGACSLFVRTSGTSEGEARSLPVSEEMLVHFRRANLEALLYYTVRARHAGVFRGRHLQVGEATALHRLGEAGEREAYATSLSGIAAASLPAWAERHLSEPGAAIAGLAEWEERLDGIINRTSQRDITLLSGLPSWALVLAGELQDRHGRAGQPIPHLQTLWPNLECFLHTGIPLAPFADPLRAALGPTVKFHEVYAAAEGFIATQDSETAAAGLRLMADLGLFFEFLPMADFDASRLPHLGPKAVPLEGVKSGVDYAVLLTTPGGLARTLLGDVVRFVSTAPPRLLYVGRTALQLNSFAEQVSEKEITESLTVVCTRHAWTIVNFHVAPIPDKVGLTGQIRGRHEWWLELKPGTIRTPKGPGIAEEVDAELRRRNAHYAARRQSGVLDGPTVRLVMPGVFEHWMRYRKIWGGDHKVPRCRSDRAIADQLAQITNFARD